MATGEGKISSSKLCWNFAGIRYEQKFYVREFVVCEVFQMCFEYMSYINTTLPVLLKTKGGQKVPFGKKE